MNRLGLNSHLVQKTRSVHKLPRKNAYAACKGVAVCHDVLCTAGNVIATACRKRPHVGINRLSACRIVKERKVNLVRLVNTAAGGVNKKGNSLVVSVFLKLAYSVQNPLLVVGFVFIFYYAANH